MSGAGRDSPLTHALGIGMEGAVSEAEFDRLEEFFRARQTNVVIDVVAPGFLECQEPPADFLDMFAGMPLVAECFLAFQEGMPVAAARAGCDLAMASVLPGSGSHRNYERGGFQLVYMRVNVSRNC